MPLYGKPNEEILLAEIQQLEERLAKGKGNVDDAEKLQEYRRQLRQIDMAKKSRSFLIH